MSIIVMNNIEDIFKQLRFKTPHIDLEENKNKEIILEFLKSEKEYQHQHKIGRLLKQSGQSSFRF